MELAQGTRKASNLSTEDDIFSSMPDNVITHILNHLPIQDAVRTSILVRNWRFKWTMLTQLVFDWDFAVYLHGKESDNWYNERHISRLLLHLKGPITKFVLKIPNCKVLDVKDINHWILFLSRKGIKEFTLLNANEIPLELPTHLFCCTELKHLKLYSCHFHSVPFCSFPNLLSLELDQVTFASGFCEIITRCPLLEILDIGFHDPISKVNLVEIAKLNNLKVLSLPLRKLDSIAITCSLIFQLGGYFPKLQELCLDLQKCKFLGEAGSRKWIRGSFPSLKTLTLYSVDFSNGIMLPFAFEIIWGSPNLQNLLIAAAYENAIAPPALCPSDLNYITMGQLQLRDVVFDFFRDAENELYLIKNILAYSPLLKRIEIRPSSSRELGGDKGKLRFATKLLKLHRASTIAEVDLQPS